jgi:hypothetical protein
LDPGLVIRDLEVEKAPDPGSGSSTLSGTFLTLFLKKHSEDKSSVSRIRILSGFNRQLETDPASTEQF